MWLCGMMGNQGKWKQVGTTGETNEANNAEEAKLNTKGDCHNKTGSSSTW